ncbi:MAG: helix-turn-helix domain-containing protein [Christensenellaceae bacterium]|nr:helix-turn-helix domain-containing protein [Christensenellaceae bacterium]
MEQNKFARRLRESLCLHGFSHLAFAKKLKTTQPTVTNWCSGKHEPDLSTLLLIARELNESIDYLLGLTD